MPSLKDRLYEPADEPRPQGKIQKNASKKRLLTYPKGASGSNLAKRAQIDNKNKLYEAPEYQTRAPVIRTGSH